MQDHLDIVSSHERTVRPGIPLTAYQPIKRCPNCQSVYLTDDKCEACGRSLNYHVVGEPFSAKSLYGLKERYHQSLPPFVRYYPRFENKLNASAQSYRRHLNKRLTHLVSALSSNDIIENDKRRFFYVELMELMDELLRYGESEHVLRSRLEEGFGFSGALITRDLLSYLEISTIEFKKQSQITWYSEFLNHRTFGVLKTELWLKFAVVTATAVTVAIVYFDIIRSQLDK